MTVKPIELANVCALFSSLRVGRFAIHDFEGHIQKHMTLEARSSTKSILAACTQCGLLSQTRSHYSLTEIGKGLSKRQSEPSPALTLGAKEFLLKTVFLNLNAGNWCCRDFILMFRADTVRGTFVYDRSDREELDILERMKLLNSVGFLDVMPRVAVVRYEYLGLLNDFLRQARTPTSEAESPRNSESNEVGALAEEKAMEYEKRRLAAAGYQELTPLVQRISLIDQSAGYDIVSCRGSGRKPEEKIYLEIKGTTKSNVCFVWTQNERAVAKDKRKQYRIYVFTNVDLAGKTARGPFRFSDPVASLPKLGFRFDPIDVYVSN